MRNKYIDEETQKQSHSSVEKDFIYAINWPIQSA